jgi:hypothetical protein
MVTQSKSGQELFAVTPLMLSKVRPEGEVPLAIAVPRL